jgi:hypothetical protein
LGLRLVWLDRAVVDRLKALRCPGESYSDVILRIAAEDEIRQRAELERFSVPGPSDSGAGDDVGAAEFVLLASGLMPYWAVVRPDLLPFF